MGRIFKAHIVKPLWTVAHLHFTIKKIATTWFMDNILAAKFKSFNLTADVRMVAHEKASNRPKAVDDSDMVF